MALLGPGVTQVVIAKAIMARYSTMDKSLEFDRSRRLPRLSDPGKGSAVFFVD